MDTMTHIDAAEKALVSFGHYISLSAREDGRFCASTYWPNGDVVRDRHCCGHGDTLAEAIAKMEAEIEKAKAKVVKLKTAHEMREAVLKLADEHDAQPDSFIEAVKAIPVSL